MLKITYGQLLSRHFYSARNKIAACPRLKSPQIAYGVAKIHARLEEEDKLAREIHRKLVDDYAKRDEDGNLVLMPNHPDRFVVKDELGEEFEARMKEFNALPLEIDRPPLNLEDLGPAELSPVEIHALDPIVRFNEATPLSVVPAAP